VEANDGSKNICTVCRKVFEHSEETLFGGAPVCSDCTNDLGLRTLDRSTEDEVLATLLDDQGRFALKDFTALARSMPSGYGWNILAILGNISKDIPEVQAQALLESSTMICGMSVIRGGKGEGEVDPKLLSLFLVLGQVMDLSIMKKLVLTNKLRTSNKLDEMILIGEHNNVLFNMIKDVPHGNDEKKEFILTTCLGKVV